MKENSTLITIILDRSSSMSVVREATIAGFNEFLKSQQAVPGEAKITLIQFDDKYEVHYMTKDIKEAKLLDFETYQPRGSTALLDAIGRTINDTGRQLAALVESERPANVVVVIQTDGEENCSKEFSRLKVFEMIRHQRDVYKWKFIFLGADQDAIASAASFGIHAAAAMSYSNNAVGNRAMYATLGASITRSRHGLSADFTEEEKRLVKNA